MRYNGKARPRDTFTNERTLPIILDSCYSFTSVRLTGQSMWANALFIAVNKLTISLVAAKLEVKLLIDVPFD